MNYDHAYHAGNFADVMKHIILIHIVQHFIHKQKPFFVIDTHGGSGLYSLHDIKAEKTQESFMGIQTFWSYKNQATAQGLINYINTVENCLKKMGQESKDPTLKFYPGSPFILQNLLNTYGRLQVYERHKDAFNNLNQNINTTSQHKLFFGDGYSGLKKSLPPSERRGLIFIDPPYEDINEFETIIQSVKSSLKRFATGTYMIWYPIKFIQQVQKFLHDLKELEVNNIFIAEVMNDAQSITSQLPGSGIAVINLPYGIKEEIENSLHDYVKIMAATVKYTVRPFWLKQPL